MSQTAQAVENALKSEKTFQTIQYAITGDRETDLIAGVLAVVSDCIYGNPQQPSHLPPPATAYWAAHRVLSYLAERVKADAELAQGREDSFRQMTQQAQGSWREVPPPSPIPGVSGLGGQIYGSSSASNIRPQMSQIPMTPEQQRQALEAMGMMLGEVKP